MTEQPVHSAREILAESLAVLWRAADRYAKGRLLLSLVLVASGAVLAALAPVALKFTVDALPAQQHGRAMLAPLTFVGLYVGGQYLARLCTELRLLTFGLGEQRLRRRVSDRAFEHVIRLPLQLHVGRKVGEIAEIAEQGLRGYQLVLPQLVYTVFPVAVEFLVAALVLLRFQHEEYLAILGTSVVAYVLIFWRGAMDIRTPAENASRHYIEARGILAEVLVNCETVKCFDAEAIVVNRHDAALRRTEAAWRLFYCRRAMSGFAVATIFTISLGLSLFWAITETLRGAMTIGGFVLVNTYVVRLVQPLEMLGFAVRDIAQGTAFLKQLLALFRETREGDSRSQNSPSDVLPGDLAFEDVSFSYPGRPVLRNVSFRVPTGHTVAVVGVSGAGKSSLIRLLLRLYKPDGGKILLCGMPICDMHLSALRQAIAVVPQDTVLFHDTISRNIGLGRRGAGLWEIQEAARAASLHEFIMGLPEGYETIVGDRGVRLSGGERQRIAIARAVLKHPRIYVFDEATSSLDSGTEREILRNLKVVARQTTTLVIAHRLSTIQCADEIVVLDRGVIVERGAHAELLACGGKYASLWAAQHGV